ncbi:2-oxo acid dehydrogenase subunit E2 [Kitasatospora sp. NPDC127116]|uniref:2-oxo acid dehydrogenase subunit E2 n=1 Tax=Kitasatospora sp. NPDC127116 TaxID=3345367 RepID=UPI0033714804
MSIGPLVRQRRHTYYFLRAIRGFAPVFLDTDVDMSRVQQVREAARESGRRYSAVAVVVQAAARALAAHPRANAALHGVLRPRIETYDRVDVKVALDKTLDGERAVLSAVLPDADRADLDEIQTWLAHYRDGDPARMAEFAPVRRLQRLPVPLGALLFRRALRPPAGRRRIMGTLAVSSLGHRPVDGFHSVGGTTITLGLGRITDRPVVRDGRVVIAPVLRVNLAFDHRVVDGAEAADLLADIKSALEDFQVPAALRRSDPTGSGRGAE